MYSVPGIHVNLPTRAGTVSFTPVFLSKEQLDKAWVSHGGLPSRLNVCHPLSSEREVSSAAVI